MIPLVMTIFLNLKKNLENDTNPLRVSLIMKGIVALLSSVPVSRYLRISSFLQLNQILTQILN